MGCLRFLSYHFKMSASQENLLHNQLEINNCLKIPAGGPHECVELLILSATAVDSIFRNFLP
jgi:hypothetical protein